MSAAPAAASRSGGLARAAPDGYTIDIGQWDTHVGSIIYNINFDLQTDFAPIGLLSINPQLMLAQKNLPANNMRELIAWMKANPGAAKFVNQNAAAHVTGILMEKQTGTKVNYIPYRGAGPAMTDLISGQVDLLVVQAAVSLPQLRAGTIKSIVNLSPQRSPSMPDIPTTDESGAPGLYMSGWFGFFAPKGTPKDIVAKLNSAMVAGARRSGGEGAVRRSRARHRLARAADAGGACRIQQGRDREVVADHQGLRHPAGLNRLADDRCCACGAV